MKRKRSEEKKALLEASQEDDTLVDPQDETVQETQDPSLEEQNDAQDDHYDSDADTVDPREENEVTNEEEEEEEVATVKRKKNDKQQQQKKTTTEPDPPQKVKDRQSKGEQKLPYPGRKKKAPDQVIYDSFKNALGDLHLEIPFADAIKVPTYTKFQRSTKYNRTK